MEYDGRLKQIKTALQGVDVGSISSFASESANVFTSINNNFNSINDGISNPAVWTDEVQVQFGDTLSTCKSAVSALEGFPSQISGVGGAIAPLVSSIEKYMQSVDSYNSLEEEYNKCRNELGSRPSKGADESVYHYNAKLASWNGRNNQVNAMKAQLAALEVAVEGQKADCYGQVAAIQGMLSGSVGEGAGAGAGAGGAGFGGSYKTRTETDEYGNTKNIVEWYDENGKKTGEDYTVVDPDGKEVEKGSKTFYDNGNVKSWKYDSEHDYEGYADDFPDRDMIGYTAVKNKEVTYREDGTIEKITIDEVKLFRLGEVFGTIKNCKKVFNEDEHVIYEHLDSYVANWSDTVREVHEGMEFRDEDGVCYYSEDKYEYIDENDPYEYVLKIGALEYTDEDGYEHTFIKEGKEYDPYFHDMVSYEEFEEIHGIDEKGLVYQRHYDKFEKSDGTIYENVNSKRVEVDETTHSSRYVTDVSEVIYQDGKKEKNVTETVNWEDEGLGLTDREIKTTYNTDGSVSHGTHEKYEAKFDEEGHRTGDVKVSETIDETKYKDGTNAQNIERKYDNEKVVEEKTGRIYRAGGGTVVNETKTYNEDGSIERHVDAEDATGNGIDIKYDATTTYNEDGSYTETIGSHANRGDSITNETIGHNEDGNVTQYYQEEIQHNDFSKDVGVNVHYDENGQFKSVDIESHTDNEKGIFGQTVEERDIHRKYDDGAITHEESDTVGQIGGIDVINFHNEKDYKTQNT